MKKLLVFMFLILGIVVFAGRENVNAIPSYYAPNCQNCHGTGNTTCAGCHAMGVHSLATTDDINLRGETNARIFSPGDMVNVQVIGGDHSGWVRAILYDQDMSELARSTGTVAPGATAPCCGPSFPVTLTATAPATPGTYTWNVAWYGNKFDNSDVPGYGDTFFGPRWTPDPNNPNHGYEIVNTNAFTVTTTPTPYILLVPASQNFGSVGTGASATRTIWVENKGNADLNVTDIALCGGTSIEYSWSPAAPFRVSPGAKQTLSLTYSPMDMGTDTGCIAISSNDPAAPVADLNTSGTGTSPSEGLNLNISQLTVTSKVSLKRAQPVSVQLSVINPGTIIGSAPATVIGMQNGAQVYNNTITVTDTPGDSISTAYAFPSYTPTATGTITWTATLNDPNPDIDTATAKTNVAK